MSSPPHQTNDLYPRSVIRIVNFNRLNRILYIKSVGVRKAKQSEACVSVRASVLSLDCITPYCLRNLLARMKTISLFLRGVRHVGTQCYLRSAIDQMCAFKCATSQVLSWVRQNAKEERVRDLCQTYGLNVLSWFQSKRFRFRGWTCTPACPFSHCILVDLVTSFKVRRHEISPHQ